MKHTYILFSLLSIVILSHGCASSTSPTSSASSTSPTSFKSPDDAVNAVVAAARIHSTDQLKQILGPSSADVLSSGDPVADHNMVDDFLKRYDEKHQLSTEADGSVTVVVGSNDWPMPIPIVKDDKTGTWHFDTDRGRDEIINRRVGRNELDTMLVCLAITDAQREYASRDPDNDGIPEYAEKFLSDPGKKNGLYWKTADGEKPSPLGVLVASASEQGYLRSETDKAPPFRGYHYRMLMAQGASATGGARSYIINGQMVGGFGVVAYPAEYGNSGVMTFIVNHEGIVYQKDLGKDTATIAKAMTEFDPGPGWEKVEPPDPNTQP